MASTYTIPMNKLVLATFLSCVGIIAAAVVWCFNSGFTWSAICLIAVAGPLSIFYWYMLYITPKRAAITVADEGILLAAPPFASAVIPWAAVNKTFTANLTDPELAIEKTKKFMHFAGYRSGVVALKNGKEAVIVSNRTDVQCLQTDDRYYLLGPDDMPSFTEAVEAVINKKAG